MTSNYIFYLGLAINLGWQFVQKDNKYIVNLWKNYLHQSKQISSISWFWGKIAESGQNSNCCSNSEVFPHPAKMPGVFYSDF